MRALITKYLNCKHYEYKPVSVWILNDVIIRTVPAFTLQYSGITVRAVRDLILVVLCPVCRDIVLVVCDEAWWRALIEVFLNGDRPRRAIPLLTLINILAGGQYGHCLLWSYLAAFMVITPINYNDWLRDSKSSVTHSAQWRLRNRSMYQLLHKYLKLFYDLRFYSALGV